MGKEKKTHEKKTKGAGRFKSADHQPFFNPTPPGQLKDLSVPMATEYDPPSVEAAWDSYWEANGCYRADEQDKKKEKFVLVIPPPNVTGTLHLGHALTCSIEDCLVRWHRMNGKNVLWVPGVDHAGIATQTVVEKKLMREEKKTRHDLGREEFLRRVWAWKDQNGSRICSQLRWLGASVDWSRECFTMDDKLSRAVQEAFLRMHSKGRIYRANRIVSWSCALRTAISSIEVDNLEIEEPTTRMVPGWHRPVEVGVLHQFAYRVKGEPGLCLVVATTRIETMLGDVAVAIHPDDKRYFTFHGKQLEHPFIPDREMKVVLDPILVDMTFGTGAVKVTPAHDENDFNCGRRNNLPSVNILNDDGTMNENAGAEFQNKHRYEVRELIVERLKQLGLHRGKVPNKMVLGLCSRSGDLVEPVIRPQWWVDCKEMAARSVEAVKKGDLAIIPEFHKKTWYSWLEDCRDWCISRQLWWGHRIPAWFVRVKGQPEPDNTDPNHWVVARSEEDAWNVALGRFKGKLRAHLSLTQDPDVLDTWFSSGLFPFSVMGWPETTIDMDRFFPGELLETGHDILFFWVARMVMMSLELTDKLPFTSVYLHAMVRDKFGRKMSKSLGNVIDPTDVITGITLEALGDKLKQGNLDPREVKTALEGQRRDYPEGIAECGTDALRFGLLAYTTQGRDINLDILRVLAYRQFCNKPWNAVKFANFHLQEMAGKWKPPTLKDLKAVEKELSNVDRWILHRLSVSCDLIQKAFNDYLFGEVVAHVHSFWKYDLCDVYLEAVKPSLYDKSAEGRSKRHATLVALCICLDMGLRLLHPLMPFVTEELYHRLPGKQYKPPIWTPVQPTATNKSSGQSASRCCLTCGRQFANSSERTVHQTQTGHQQGLPMAVEMQLDPAAPAVESRGDADTVATVAEDPIITASRAATNDKSWRSKRAEAAQTCIVLQAYPTPRMVGSWRNDELAAEMETVKQVAASARSMLVSFNITHKKTELFLICTEEKTAKLMRTYNQQAATLSFCAKLNVLHGELAPKGCVSTVVSPEMTLAIQAKGNLDLAAEVLKLKARDKLLTSQLDQFTKMMHPDRWCKVKPEGQEKALADQKAAEEEHIKVKNSITSFLKVIDEDPVQYAKYREATLASLKRDQAKCEKAKAVAVSKLPPEGSGKKPSEKALKAVADAEAELAALNEQIAALEAGK